ncbi:MAG: 16S rRNA (guanine(966)-N(2))-methyltransferase RsmD [Ectothiorhodospiraceae bacterium]
MSGRGRNRVRIIAGTWGGRRLQLPAVPGLRPSADSSRETLFNWLQDRLPGSRCLDLFAGSGALGLEAASRGAGQVILAENNRRAVAQLREHVTVLEAGDRVRVHAGDGLALLKGPAEPMDVVFLDPPFASDLLEPACQALASGGWTHTGTRVYIEHRRNAAPQLPATWQTLRSRTSGEAAMLLLACNNDAQ